MKEGDVLDTQWILCAHCASSYTAYTENSGHDCDATARHQETGCVVTCGYGSNHDLMRFTYAPNTFPQGEICNTCLDTAARTGALRRIDCYAYDIDAAVSLTALIQETFPNFSSHDVLVVARNLDPSMQRKTTG